MRLQKIFGIASCLLLTSCMTGEGTGSYRFRSELSVYPFAISIGDSVRVGVDLYDKDSNWVRSKAWSYVWTVGGKTQPKTTSPVVRFVAPQEEDTNFSVSVLVLDRGEVILGDGVRVPILSDYPVAKALVLGSVGTDSLFRVDAFESKPGMVGDIIQYEWSVGTLDDFKPGSDTLLVKAPSQPNPKYPIVLRVTDDDGFKDTDTLFVEVRKAWSLVARSREMDPTRVLSGVSYLFAKDRLYMADSKPGFAYFEDGRWTEVFVPASVTSNPTILKKTPEGDILVAYPPSRIFKFTDGVWEDFTPSRTLGLIPDAMDIRDVAVGDSGTLYFRTRDRIYRWEGDIWKRTFEMKDSTQVRGLTWGLQGDEPVIVTSDAQAGRITVQILEDTVLSPLGPVLPVRATPEIFRGWGGTSLLSVSGDFDTGGFYSLQGGEWKRLYLHPFRTFDVIRDTVYAVAVLGSSVFRFDGNEVRQSAPGITTWYNEHDQEKAFHISENGDLHMVYQGDYWMYR